MQRILITGNSGAGKTTLANQVAQKLDLPVYSLDSIVWQRGWKKTPPEEKEERILALVARESWVIDGVSLSVQDRSDTVVFLDQPRRLSLLRVLRRNWRYLFRSRPGLPPNCPEILVIPKLFALIWNFPVKVRGRILERMQQAKDKQMQFQLRTRREIGAFLAFVEDHRERGTKIPNTAERATGDKRAIVRKGP